MKIEFTNRCHDIVTPSRASERAAGFDLRAAVETPTTLAPGSRALVPTGICMAIPAGHEAQIRPRSGLAAKHGVTLLNSPGTIDSDYRGEIAVLLINHGDAPFVVNRGDRIAQLVIAAVAPAELVEVGTLDETERGEGGFGSSGMR
jgi:dUTP pyrophosphatase